MERRIYTPVEYMETDFDKPVIFLAGPIQGAPNWQDTAIEIIHSQMPEVIIASPRKDYLDNSFNYNEQVDWESYHLEKAASTGVIMFWLAREVEHDPERAYAQTTRAELFDWKNRPGNIVIGIESGFSGEKYIRRRFKQDRPEVKIFDTLEETCLATLQLVPKSPPNQANRG
jgi:hypothetical protein